MKQWSHLNTAITVLQGYSGEQPFASYIREFFSRDKKYGSKDRKQISHLCYCFFRAGRSFGDKPMEERIISALFLCTTISNDILQQLKPEWNKAVKQSLEEKWKLIDGDYAAEKLFPWTNEIASDIDIDAFARSMLVQPDLYLRVRPGKEKIVLSKLNDAGMEFQQLSADCLALPNASKVEFILDINREVIVQDYSSQAIGDFFDKIKPAGGDAKLSVWDCCAASGGKSIMAVDRLGDIDLIVSDIRESILVNLRKRFGEAGVKNYKSFKVDLTKEAFAEDKAQFDLIIADVPCTGSGTWSRTPEQLYYFDPEKIDQYAARQKSILSNIIPSIKPAGHLLYITCSVFRKENEDVLEFIQQNYNLKLIESRVLKGYDKKADTLFAATLRLT